MNQNQSSMQAPMQAPIQASMQTPTQPQFVIQPQQPGQSGWDKAMGYSASCGKFVGLSTAVISVILIIIFCWVGIYFYRKKSTVVYDKVSATITEANCTQQITDTGRNRNVTYKCSLKVNLDVIAQLEAKTLITPLEDLYPLLPFLSSKVCSGSCSFNRRWGRSCRRFHRR